MSIAVIGAGTIGVGWAVVFARAGHEVALYDPDPARREAAPAELSLRFGELAEFGVLDREPAPIALHARLEEALYEAEHVQECAPEDLALKRELFARLDALAPPGVPLASSSSALTASRFAPGRARVLVAHPGNPPHLLPIVELVPAPFTSEAVVDRVYALLRDAGMSPVRLRREIDGFVFNRLQGAVLREAYCLVRDGVVEVEDIDRVMREGLGRRYAVIGPFETADLNTRGGIEEHARRLGPAYARMGAERGQDDPWTPELVAHVTAQRRALLPLTDWDERVEWRDRMLLALERARREAS
ncbi:3-hydroxyacyl-CoA dehydrogenase [Candidatus Solirubrobacter pratensis]|uniref:3-hydroxyacyl-CoA dehydrogenase n=1 Tax=Candidatus Solirubrobacter pratensis TaxID=1298857 RepID=UPI0004050EAA|nr:3-hydroxyacyl-CoA dehydrogenase [Candidatus Solirubrobacter pratensis]